MAKQANADDNITFQRQLLLGFQELLLEAGASAERNYLIQLPQVRKPAFYLHYLHLTPSQLTFVEIYLAPDQQKLTFVEIYLAPDYKKLTLVIHESHDKRGEPSQKNPKAWDKSGEPPRDDGELRFFHGEPPHEQVQEVQQKQPL